MSILMPNCRDLPSYFTCISLVYMVGFSLIVYMFDFILVVKSFFVIVGFYVNFLMWYIQMAWRSRFNCESDGIAYNPLCRFCRCMFLFKLFEKSLKKPSF